MQPVDFTTLVASCAALRQGWLPARVEQVYQCDRHTLALGLRTLQGRGWLTLCWHPQGARLHLGDSPPRDPDTFTFSKQVLSQIKGLALSQIALVAPWERVVDLQFAPRPDEPAHWHLYLEVMGKYSNALLVNADDRIVSVAHQVSSGQSRIRPIQTGQPYPLPPLPPGSIPRRDESLEQWQAQVNLVPGPLAKVLRQSYRGLSSALAQELVQGAGLDPQCPSDRLSPPQWQALFTQWQRWLQALEQESFRPGWTATGYTVIGGDPPQGLDQVHPLLHQYYGQHLRRHHIQQLQHQLGQRVRIALTKANHKAAGFRDRLQQSDGADDHRHQGDLIMAHLHHWQPGLQQLPVLDFATGEQRLIPLEPTKTAVQLAQGLYKKHQKLKRARLAVEPLLATVDQEVRYLEQVEETLQELGSGGTEADWLALREVQEELYLEGYGTGQRGDDRPLIRKKGKVNRRSQTDFYRYRSPQGLEVWVGRNNHQNDDLTFRVATAYDLWFHAQEIPGSHVLLRLEPGQVPEAEDLAYAADVASYHSRARQGDRAPVVYTEPRHVYKPNGAAPGLVIYKHERILWGSPQNIAPLSHP
ncbi:Rqc2 family fibronectin-binding protein [Prochlorothrix hollandica]|uniref:Rqc2 family fibronectin-binding protein n=1 Tax=Prochlorothrix hollandica TaxID=1223 RepID=UPI003340F647